MDFQELSEQLFCFTNKGCKIQRSQMNYKLGAKLELEPMARNSFNQQIFAKLLTTC